MKNQEPYEGCETTKVTDLIKKQRRAVLVHALRSNVNTPAFYTSMFALTNTFKKGGQQNNNFTCLERTLRNEKRASEMLMTC